MTRETTAIHSTSPRFEFGRNWTGFVRRHLSAERIDITGNYLLQFVDRNDLRGLDFLDIGSGSGIHSAAAWKTGADRILSFDYDPNSVAATKIVQEAAGSPANWTVIRGDVLDRAFVESLGKWKFVYSWGVLHHTGNVWQALDNACSCVAESGLLYIALYSADVQPDCDFWLEVKRKYNQASPWRKRQMVWWYVWNYLMGRRLTRIPEVIARATKYRMNRGMSMLVDVRDWLGGWPMEFCYDRDVLEFLQKRGFVLRNIKAGEACTEFVFLNKAGDRAHPPMASG